MVTGKRCFDLFASSQMTLKSVQRFANNLYSSSNFIYLQKQQKDPKVTNTAVEYTNINIKNLLRVKLLLQAYTMLKRDYWIIVLTIRKPNTLEI